MTYDSADRRDRGVPIAQSLRPIVVATALTVVAASLAWLCVALFPTALLTPQNPDYLDNIFASREIVWIARLWLASAALVLVVAGVFVVTSTVVRMRNGHWLKRAGPFEVSERTLGRTAWREDYSDDSAHEGYDEAADLRVQLAITSELIEKIQHKRAR
ncbi:MAG TPA: hypothetical protein VK506_15160 [Conexibacter sp.]|nr:hypothetical protein [Conexibacter sp.]